MSEVSLGLVEAVLDEGFIPVIASVGTGMDGFYNVNADEAASAVAAKAEVADLMRPGDHGSTFGGNPLAAACARATVETLVSEGIGEHVISVGARPRAELGALPHVV